MSPAEMIVRESSLRELLEALSPCWKKLSEEIQLRRAQLVEQLISKDNEAIRGGIKELDLFLALPVNLRYEQKDLVDALSVNDASARKERTIA